MSADRVVDVRDVRVRRDGWWIVIDFGDSRPTFGVHWGLRRRVIWWTQLADGKVLVLTTSDHLWFSLDTFNGVKYLPGAQFKLDTLPDVDAAREHAGTSCQHADTTCADTTCQHIGTYGVYDLHVSIGDDGMPTFTQARATRIATCGVLRRGKHDEIYVNDVQVYPPAGSRYKVLSFRDSCAMFVAYDVDLSHRGVYIYRLATDDWEEVTIGELPPITEERAYHVDLVTAKHVDGKWTLVLYDERTRAFAAQIVKGAESVQSLAVKPGINRTGRALFSDGTVSDVSFTWDGKMNTSGSDWL